MKYLGPVVFLLCCLMALQPCFGQAQKQDSLWAVWNDPNQPDTARLLAIHRIAWSTWRNNADSAFVLAQMELSFAKLKKLGKWEAAAYNTIATIYYAKGDYSNALEYYRYALIMFKKLGNTLGIATSLFSTLLMLSRI